MAESIRVEVVYVLPERYWTASVLLPVEATVAEAIAASELLGTVPGLVVDDKRLAVFGKPVTSQTALRDGDRVEILRPLIADPKQVRRKRAEREKQAD